MKRTLEFDLTIQNGQGVILFPADIPDGRVHLMVTLTTRAVESSASPQDEQPEDEVRALLRQWHQLGLSKNEMVKRLGGDVDRAWRLINEFAAGR